MDLPTPKLEALSTGGHLCFPYESAGEKRLTVVTFIRGGLARRERCLYIGAPAEQADLMAALASAGVEAERELARGSLVLATTRDTYLRTGRFDGDDALAVMEGLVDRALADGFAGLRATGEASGPVPDEIWPLVVRYEALLNDRLGRRPFVALCRLHATQSPPARFQDMLRTHPHALLRGDVCDNPFFERSEVALGDDARTRLEWQLHQLRVHNRARQRLENRSEAASRQTDDALDRSAQAWDRFLSVLSAELADPLFALKREVHALGATLDETPPLERLEAAQRHLRRLSTAVQQARDAARLFSREGREGVAARGEALDEVLDEAPDEALDEALDEAPDEALDDEPEDAETVTTAWPTRRRPSS
jgi:hypothetical protein